MDLVRKQAGVQAPSGPLLAVYNRPTISFPLSDSSCTDVPDQVVQNQPWSDLIWSGSGLMDLVWKQDRANKNHPAHFQPTLPSHPDLIQRVYCVSTSWVLMSLQLHRFTSEQILSQHFETQVTELQAKCWTTALDITQHVQQRMQARKSTSQYWISPNYNYYYYALKQE